MDDGRLQEMLLELRVLLQGSALYRRRWGARAAWRHSEGRK